MVKYTKRSLPVFFKAHFLVAKSIVFPKLPGMVPKQIWRWFFFRHQITRFSAQGACSNGHHSPWDAINVMLWYGTVGGKIHILGTYSPNQSTNHHWWKTISYHIFLIILVQPFSFTICNFAPIQREHVGVTQMQLSGELSPCCVMSCHA